MKKRQSKERLYDRNFTILVLGQIISLFGSAIQRFAFSLYILDLTGSAGLFSTILAFSMIPIIVMSPIAGVLSDRVSKKSIMVWLDFISAGLILGYTLLLLSGQSGVIAIAILMFLLSGISTVYQPAVTASIPGVVSEENLLKANSVVQQVSSLSNFLGPILAGMLYGLFGILGIVIVNGFSFLASAIMELFLHIPQIKRENTEGAYHIFKKDMTEALRYLRYENLVVLRMTFSSGLFNLFLVPVFSVVTPFVIMVSFEQTSTVYGITEGAIALGMIIGALFVGLLKRHVPIQAIYKVLYLVSLSMVGMALILYLEKRTITTEVAIIGYALCGMLIMGAIGYANVVSATYLQQATRPDMLGKISAFGAGFATLCVPLGQVLFGGVIELLANSMFILMLFAACSTFLVTLFVRWNVRHIKKEYEN